MAEVQAAGISNLAQVATATPPIPLREALMGMDMEVAKLSLSINQSQLNTLNTIIMETGDMHTEEKLHTRPTATVMTVALRVHHIPGIP